MSSCRLPEPAASASRHPAPRPNAARPRTTQPTATRKTAVCSHPAALATAAARPRTRRRGAASRAAPRRQVSFFPASRLPISLSATCHLNAICGMPVAVGVEALPSSPAHRLKSPTPCHTRPEGNAAWPSACHRLPRVRIALTPTCSATKCLCPSYFSKPRPEPSHGTNPNVTRGECHSHR